LIASLCGGLHLLIKEEGKWLCSAAFLQAFYGAALFLWLFAIPSRVRSRDPGQEAKACMKLAHWMVCQYNEKQTVARHRE
jgi:hypothetical protein